MELPAEVLTLCLSAGTALANSMASDLWSSIRTKFARFFSESQANEHHEARLDRDHHAIVSTSGEQQVEVIERVSANWTTRLQDLLEARPEAIPALAELVRDLKAEGIASSGDITNMGINQQADRGGHNIYSGRDTRISK